ncbi:MAG TPA: hypothetical protein VN731_10200 [Rhodanobacter sp.]|nr:hypothetical protein [Rhodanobacter sp.]
MNVPNLFDKPTQDAMHALYGTPGRRTDAWYARQLKHAQECLAVADKVHTPEELAVARAELAIDPTCPQRQIFEAKK